MYDVDGESDFDDNNEMENIKIMRIISSYPGVNVLSFLVQDSKEILFRSQYGDQYTSEG